MSKIPLCDEFVENRKRAVQTQLEELRSMVCQVMERGHKHLFVKNAKDEKFFEETVSLLVQELKDKGFKVSDCFCHNLSIRWEVPKAKQPKKIFYNDPSEIAELFIRKDKFIKRLRLAFSKRPKPKSQPLEFEILVEEVLPEGFKGTFVCKDEQVSANFKNSSDIQVGSTAQCRLAKEDSEWHYAVNFKTT